MDKSVTKEQGNLSELVKRTKQVKKLSDKDFWRILRKNGALYARTARAIESQYGIPYSRQAVRDRAEKNPVELADIEGENADTAEEVVFSLFRSSDERVKADIAKFYLKTKAKERGYIERQEITGKDGADISMASVIYTAKHERLRALEDNRIHEITSKCEHCAPFNLGAPLDETAWERQLDSFSAKYKVDREAVKLAVENDIQTLGNVG